MTFEPVCASQLVGGIWIGVMLLFLAAVVGICWLCDYAGVSAEATASEPLSDTSLAATPTDRTEPRTVAERGARA